MSANMFRTLRADEIECRVQSIRQNGLVLLLYKDARCDQYILDETVGPLNWQRHHSRDNANCIVSIWDASKGEWIEKEDTGTESNTEAAKGLASDSFKRACFNVGIGRELYSAPFTWIPADKCNISNNNGRLACYDRFRVMEIDYDDTPRRDINHLVVVNGKNGQVVFRWDKPGRLDTLKCDHCGGKITGTNSKEGGKLTAEQVIAASRLKWGRDYCANCARQIAAAETAQKVPDENPG